MSFIGNRPDSYGYSSTTYEHFSGNSSNTSFSLSRAVSSNSDVQVVVNNVIQDPGVSYYITDLYTLTFYSAPSAGTDNIYVVYRNFINTGIGLGANSVSSEVIKSRAINTSHLGNITEINSGVGNSLTLKSNNISAVTINNSGDVTISGNLSVEGSTTTINTETLIIEDKNIVLGNVASPTNVTADGAGISVLGDTDKTFNWVSANSSWESSENLNLVSGKSYKIGNTAVLSSTTLGSGVLSSSLTSLGTLGSLAVSGNSSFSNISSSGNLGIGTNSPAQKLEIRGNGGGDTVTLQLTNDGSHPARLRLHSGHGNWSVGNSITVGNALEFRDESSSLTRMLIDSSGNVGIGASSSGQKLDITGNQIIRHDSYDAFTILGNSSNSIGLRIQNTYSGARNWNIVVTGGSIGTNGSLAFYDDSGGGTRMLIDPNGNVGIGVSPSYKLDTTTIRATNSIISGNTSYGMELWYAGSNNNRVAFYGANTTTTITKPTPTASNGSRFDIGVGSLNSALSGSFWNGWHWTTPDVIVVSGSNSFPRVSQYWQYTTATNPTDLTFWYYAGNYPSANTMSLGFGTISAGNITFATLGTERLRIDSSGKVGIGTTNPNFALEVHKQITIKGNNPSTNAEYQDWPDCSFNIRRSDDFVSNGITMASFGYRSDATYFTDNSVCNIRIWDTTQAASASTSASTTKLTLGSPGSFSIITGNSSERLFINSAGNVGIGTNSVDGKLTIVTAQTANAANKVKIQGYQVGYEVLNAAQTQNWYFGVADADSNKLYIGRGYGVGQAMTPAIAITTSDIVTTPNQPLFTAYGNSTGTTFSAATTILYENAVNNVGNCYNASTSIFTAPVSGYYYFSASFLEYPSNATGYVTFYISKNGAGYSTSIPMSRGTPISQETMECGGIVYLAANDNIRVRVECVGNAYYYTAAGHAHFHGYLLG